MFSSSPFDSSPGWDGYDVSILRATREPCPVCGHPTGDCTGPGQTAPPEPVFRPEREVPRYDDPVVLVTEDIWQDVRITSLTKTRVLVAKAGTYLPLAKAREYGLV
jgi:hypothetical protein